ncbi:hypothetical protein GCM10027271_46170 [Saccharopolyspora gloriosae]
MEGVYLTMRAVPGQATARAVPFGTGQAHHSRKHGSVSLRFRERVVMLPDGGGFRCRLTWVCSPFSRWKAAEGSPPLGRVKSQGETFWAGTPNPTQKLSP